MLPTWRGSNSQPPDHQLDAHQTEPLRLARALSNLNNGEIGKGYSMMNLLETGLQPITEFAMSLQTEI